ncbi:hypothetical protein CEE45_06895 [Candidatus Heimdallarchaeota archaeon B3_Heim]|nr:MAG: hypothetical protein CEE45_06895 [Candidatus Heimdallarchaeota archaeon B3_Heim]
MNSGNNGFLLEGRLITPIITKKTHFKIHGCKAMIQNPRRRYYTKIQTAKPMYPYSFICYLGKLTLEYRHESLQNLKHKLITLLQLTHLGKLQGEGLGEIQWTRISFQNKPTDSRVKIKTPKLRIRKGLPLKLSIEQQELLKYALLHDFFHTSKHQSKIYQEPPLTDQSLVKRLQQHHEKTNDPLIRKFQYYDRLAASITRKIRSPVISRYNWQAKRTLQKINFIKLAKNIQEVTNTNIWNLYRYIYESKELKLLNESMNHGHTTLHNHLIVIANLIVQDFERFSAQRKTRTQSN